MYRGVAKLYKNGWLNYTKMDAKDIFGKVEKVIGCFP